MKFLIALLLSIYNALVFSYLWGWFVIDIFNVPELSLLQTYGLLLIVSLLKLNKKDTEMQIEDIKNKVNVSEYTTYSLMFISISLVWGIAYLITLIG